jgi:hypothetical protein
MCANKHSNQVEHVIPTVIPLTSMTSDPALGFMVDSLLALLSPLQRTHHYDHMLSEYTSNVVEFVKQRSKVTERIQKTSLLDAIGDDLCQNILSFMEVDKSLLPFIYVCKTFNHLVSNMMWKTATIVHVVQVRTRGSPLWRI